MQVGYVYYIIKWKNELRIEWRKSMQNGILNDYEYTKAHNGGVGPAEGDKA